MRKSSLRTVHFFSEGEDEKFSFTVLQEEEVARQTRPGEKTVEGGRQVSIGETELGREHGSPSGSENHRQRHSDGDLAAVEASSDSPDINWTSLRRDEDAG